MIKPILLNTQEFLKSCERSKNSLKLYRTLTKKISKLIIIELLIIYILLLEIKFLFFKICKFLLLNWLVDEFC